MNVCTDDVRYAEIFWLWTRLLSDLSDIFCCPMIAWAISSFYSTVKTAVVVATSAATPKFQRLTCLWWAGGKKLQKQRWKNPRSHIIYVINGVFKYIQYITKNIKKNILQLDTTMYSCSVLECTIPSSVLLSSEAPSKDGLRCHEMSPDVWNRERDEQKNK